MTQRLILIHTVPPLPEVFNRLTAELLPGVRVMHILDAPLPKRVRQRGVIAAENGARLAAHVAEAAVIGTSAVVVTCSTISSAVDFLAAVVPSPTWGGVGWGEEDGGVVREGGGAFLKTISLLVTRMSCTSQVVGKEVSWHKKRITATRNSPGVPTSKISGLAGLV